jgi:hypothetical protein
MSSGGMRTKSVSPVTNAGAEEEAEFIQVYRHYLYRMLAAGIFILLYGTVVYDLISKNK